MLIVRYFQKCYYNWFASVVNLIFCANSGIILPFASLIESFLSWWTNRLNYNGFFPCIGVLIVRKKIKSCFQKWFISKFTLLCHRKNGRRFFHQDLQGTISKCGKTLQFFFCSAYHQDSDTTDVRKCANSFDLTLFFNCHLSVWTGLVFPTKLSTESLLVAGFRFEDVIDFLPGVGILMNRNRQTFLMFSKPFWYSNTFFP